MEASSRANRMSEFVTEGMRSGCKVAELLA